MTQITPGPWVVNSPDDSGDWFLTAPGKDPLAYLISVEADARVMVAAVEACFALNPTDPLSAAQHLEALVKAAQAARLFLGRISEGNSTVVTMTVWACLDAALSRVTGKGPA